MSLVSVAAYREPHAAHIARAALEAEGIPAFVSHEHLIGLDWTLSLALGGVKLQVPSEHAGRARELLRQDRSAEVDACPEAALPLSAEDLCPRCGSPSIQRRALERATKALSLLVNIPFTVRRDAWRCQACSHTWRMRRSHASPLAVLGYLAALPLLLLAGLARRLWKRLAS